MRISAIAATILVAMALTADAQQKAQDKARAPADYPAKAITIIVPEVPGSAADILSRIIGKSLGEALGQAVNYENLFLEAGVEKAIHAAPDGTTLMYGSSGNVALLPHVKKVAWNPMRDLTPVGRFVIQPTLIASNTALPVKTLQDLVALIKANPGKIKMATAGEGTAGHFAGEMLIAMTAIKPDVTHYKGGGPAIEAVVNGDAQFTVAPIAGRMSYVESGKLRALAIGGPSRLKLLPDVPTVAEAGFGGYEATGWGAIFVPNGTPQPIIDKLNATIANAAASPETRKLFEAQGTEPAAGTQAEMAELLRQEYARQGDVAKRLGLKVD